MTQHVTFRASPVLVARIDRLAEALPAPPPTEEQLQRQQELQERNRQWQQMGRATSG